MAKQYYNFTKNGEIYVKDTKTKTAKKVSSIPSGAPTITYTGRVSDPYSYMGVKKDTQTTPTPTPVTPTPIPTPTQKTTTKKVQKSLISIWGEREDLQREFPNPLGKGVSANWTINDWWNMYGVKEMPDVQLIQPDQKAVEVAGYIEGFNEGDTRVNPVTNKNEVLTPDGTWQEISDTSIDTGKDDVNTVNDTNGDGVEDDLGVDTSGWSQDMIDIFTQMTDLLEAQIAAGNTINPDIEIDETTVAGFLDQAQKELDPYYSSLIEMAKKDLTDTFRYKQESQQLAETQTERQYGKDLEQMGIGYAETGEAYSGKRIKSEQELAQSTQEAVDQSRRDFFYQTTGLGTAAERTYGSKSLKDLSFPTIAGKPQIIAGKAQWARGGETSLYELSGEITGEIEKEKEVAERTRASELESVYRSKRALDYS